MRSPAALLYHAGGLGDFITAIPTIRFWKKHRSPGRIVLLGIPAIGEMAMDAGIVDALLDARSSRFLPLWQEEQTPEADVFLHSFSSALVFADPDSPLLRAIRRSAIQAVFSQPPFPSGNDRHIIDYHLSLFDDMPLSATAAARIPRIIPSPDAMAAVRAMASLDPAPVALHPGSGSALKNWPLERFKDCSGRLRAEGIPVLWIQGPAEALFPVVLPEPAIVEPPLPALGAILSRCRAFIGNDSGIAHLAAAVGCPTVAVFGPSDPALWAPRGERVRIIYKSNGCTPCHPTSTTANHCGRPCLTAIIVEKVVEAVFAEKKVYSREGSICPELK